MRPWFGLECLLRAVVIGYLVSLSLNVHLHGVQEVPDDRSCLPRPEFDYQPLVCLQDAQRFHAVRGILFGAYHTHQHAGAARRHCLCACQADHKLQVLAVTWYPQQELLPSHLLTEDLRRVLQEFDQRLDFVELSLTIHLRDVLRGQLTVAQIIQYGSEVSARAVNEEAALSICEGFG